MFWQELEAMREEAKAKNMPPRYMGKWGSASQAEIDAELEKGTPYTYRFRVPQEGSVTIHDLIRGEVANHCLHYYVYFLAAQFLSLVAVFIFGGK